MGGASAPGDYSGVRVVNWQPVGGYALAFAFSDGHRTGIYPFPLLRQLGDEAG